MKKLLLALALAAGPVFENPLKVSANDSFNALLGEQQAVLLAQAASTKLPALTQAAAPSKTELWMNSIEYAALRFQNGWEGWSDSYTPVSGVRREISWMSSAEYADQCAQSYAQAWVSTMMSARSGAGAMAVVMDIDETVLDTSQYQIERGDAGYSPDSFDAWIKRRAAGTVPSAKAFIDMVRSLGHRVHLVYITDRSQAQEADTIENLRANGLYRSGDLVLTKMNKADTKEVRRLCVQTGRTGSDERCKAYEPMKIISIVGDSIRDFYEVYGRQAADEKIRTVSYDARWGTFFFMIPNPMYGQWERDYK